MARKVDLSEFPTAEAYLPRTISLPALKRASKGCQGCPLWKTGTQTVFGEGPGEAKVMVVGEQPGDQEDKAGRPFVGPSGRLLDEALEAVGIERGEVYVTNAVKHFKWEARGTRRIHSKPSAREMAACRPWLVAEIEVVKPAMIVCLGATAAQGLLGKEFKITQRRGEVITDSPYAPWVMATYHPSAILRMPDKEMRERARGEFVGDWGKVKATLKRVGHDTV